MNPRLKTGTTWVRRTLTTGLTGIAFFNSYSHTVQWFSDNGQKSSAHALALMPEGGLVLVVLTLVTVQLDRTTQAVLALIGIGSLALTLTSNVSQAGDGVMGVGAALAAPGFAVLGFTLEVRSLVQEDRPASVQLAPAEVDRPTVQVQINNTVQAAAQISSAEPVQVDREPVQVDREPVQVDREPVQVQEEAEPVQKVVRPAPVRRAISSGSVQVRWTDDRRAAHEWASAQPEWPTVKALTAQFPMLSLSTAKRVKPLPAGEDS